MSVMQILSLHRPPADRAPEHIRALTIVEGLVALVALVAFVGALAGAVTYALVRLVSHFVG